MRRLRQDDFFKLRFLSDLNVSGEKIAFTVTRPDRRKDDYQSAIWMYERGLKKFTAGPKDRCPRWSVDGKRLAFVSERGKEGENGIFIIGTAGGEAEQVCAFKGKISSISWSHDGRAIFFLGTTDGAKGRKSDVKVIGKFPFYFNGKGFLDGRETHIYSTSLSGRIARLTDGPMTVNQFAVSPAGKHIAFTARKDEWDIYTSELFVCDTRGKHVTPVTGAPAGYGAPSFSPDGGRIAFTYRAPGKTIFQHSRIALLETSGGKPEDVASADRNPGNSINSDSRVAGDLTIRWSQDGRSLTYISTDGENCSIFATNIAEGRWWKTVDVPGSVESFDAYRGGFAFISQDAARPTELHTCISGRVARRSNFNRGISSMKLKKPEHHSFTSSDGTVIEGWLLSYSKGRSVPGILEIHGGPKTAYGDAFMFEFQLLASRGYALFYTNPRGSDGYTDAFSGKVRQHFGEGDYSDIMEGVDFFLRRAKNINGKRLGVTGGSYGGFMTNWIVGHTDRFRAAVTQRSISNQISFFGTSDIGPWFNGDQIGGTPWEHLETYWEKSPLKFARDIHTPLLIIHSEEDYRCPVEQAYQMYSALKYFNREVEMRLFPGENHELSRSGKPRHRVERLGAILDWFDSHLK